MTDVESLYSRLRGYQRSNYLVNQYYDGEVRVQQFNISVPPILSRINTVIGWPGTVVDVLEERLSFLGWDDDGKYGLEDAYIENAMDNESSLTNIDTLLYGVGYTSISTGDESLDEPPGIITAESARDTTGIWDKRTRRLKEAVTRYPDDEGKYTKLVHYELVNGKCIITYYRRDTDNSPWRKASVDNNRLPRLPIVRQANKGRAGRPGGKSEITRAIRAYTDTAVRTLLGMEVNREFFQAPQRYVLGAKDDAFVDEAGNPIPGWRAILGSLWGLERDEVGAEETDYKWDGLPKVGQFPANPPGPYLEQLRGLSMLVAAESGMPPNYLGFATDNPPSADSIRALEARLVTRAERRQSAWTPQYREIGQIYSLVTGKGMPASKDIQVNWRDAATPTKAADADRATKLVSATILPPDSQVTYEMAGLTPRQIRQIEKDRTSSEFKAILTQGMTGAPAQQAATGQDQQNVPTGSPAQPNNAAAGNTPVASSGS